MRPPPRKPERSGVDERSPVRRPADQPGEGGGALVEHLAERAARAERELRHVRERLAATDRNRSLLSAAARQLAEVPTVPTDALVRRFIPALGQWCLVDEIARGDATRQLVTTDPALGRAAAEIDGPFVPTAGAGLGLGRVLEGGGIERLHGRAGVDAMEPADSPAHAAITRIAGGPLLVVPVTARGCVVGALTFGRAATGADYDDDAERLAGELATLVALAHEQRQAAEAAELAVRAKARFLTTMSHELRTPLNAIAGYAQLLDMGFRGPLTDDQRDAVGRILRGQEHLLALVDAVLTFSHLTGGRLTITPTAVPVGEVLDAVERDYRGRFAEADVRLVVTPCREGTLASADPERAAEVLRHLLDNALKFTPSGGRVQVRCEAGAGVVRFVVEDTGRGIPAAHCQHIFEPFVQVEKELTRSADGSGLGLAVARELAERMGGTLTVTSAPELGSRFVFTLPRLERRQVERLSIDSPPTRG